LVGAVEGEEPDAGGSIGGGDIGADICFGDVAVVGEGEEAIETDVFHPEGDESDIGFALVGLDLEAGWEKWLDEFGAESAVEECEVVPTLAHDGGLVGVGAELFELGEGILVDSLILACFSF